MVEVKPAQVWEVYSQAESHWRRACVVNVLVNQVELPYLDMPGASDLARTFQADPRRMEREPQSFRLVGYVNPADPLQSVGRVKATPAPAEPLRVVGAQTANERSRGLPLAGEVMRWLVTGKGMLTYSPSIIAPRPRCWRNWQPPCAMHLRLRQLQKRLDRRTRGDAGPQRRRLADAAAVARLCRGQAEPAGRRAGDQPALPVGRNRPARDHRRVAIGAADFGAPALQPLVREESLPGT